MEFDRTCPKCGYINTGDAQFCEKCGVKIQFDPGAPEAFDLEFREGSADYGLDPNATTERSNPVNLVERVSTWIGILLLIGILFLILRACGMLKILFPYAGS